MKKKKILLGLTLAAASLFALASCGSKKDNDKTTTTTETTVVSSTEETSTAKSTTPAESTKSTTPAESTKSTTPAESTKSTTPAESTKSTTPAESTKSTTPAESTTTSTTPVESTVSTTTTTTATPSEQEEVAAITMNGTAYDTITAALAAIPTSGTTDTYTILLQPGTYAENGLGYNGSATVKIKGNTTAKYGADVIITGHGNNMGQERGRELLEIQGTANVILENISLESDMSRADGAAQCEVLGTDTKGYTVAYNCGFKSHQDTLRTAGKAWFYGCYVEGDVDFIWMEQGGQVALYEECEIVSVYDQYATSHATYICAPRMTPTNKASKGLVIYNSTVKESAEAVANGQDTYLARTPWSSGVYNQVAYINTTCENINVSAGPWYKTQVATDYAKTVIGWKMDQATATSLGYAGNDDIISAEDAANEFGGRRTILNRLYNTDKNKYEKDTATNWDIDAVIADNNFTVTEDTSSDTLDGETVGETVSYVFDGNTDYSSMYTNFKQDGSKPHIVGEAGATITVPVEGKCYVEVYGYYSGQAMVQAFDSDSVATEGETIMFYNNGSTSSEVYGNYTVYDADSKSVVVTAQAKTYITKIVVTYDSSIVYEPVTDIEISGSTTNYTVGVALTLSATITPTTATNKAVAWSSSNTEYAKIDENTGKVTFLKPGEVTFTATARDGSGTTETFTCTAQAANWKKAEFYTTDGDFASQDGAIEIGNFDVNNSSNKSLSTEYTYTNLSGVSFTTKYGLKLNGDGKLTIPTTKGGATLTIVTCLSGKEFETPKVTNGTDVLTAQSDVANEDGTTHTYTFRLESAGTWNITRAGSKEVNPILYASCIYDDAVISENMKLAFGTTDGNYQSEITEYFEIDATVVDHNSNSSKIYGGTITFTVAAGASVNVYANWGENYTISDNGNGEAETHTGTGVGADGNRTYTYASKTKIVITCDPESTGTNYFYWINVTFQ